jgi:sirohydrochlorin cobaltochelatase
MIHANLSQGVVLFAHGSRDPLWHKPIEAVAARMRATAPQVPVACAYLELSTPDLPTATADLLAHGVQSISIVPLFLGVGRHAREDLPVLVEALRLQHPQVIFNLQSAVGENERLIALLADIALNPLQP